MLYGSFPFWECAKGVNVSFIPCEVVNYHLVIISKVGFHNLWISGVIEMMTPFNLLCFGDGGPIWTPIERLIQLCFSVQGVSNLSTPFKGCSKTPLPLSLIFHKPLSRSATVVRTAPCRWGSVSLPHINLPSHFTTADNSTYRTHPETGRVLSLQPPPWIKAVVWTVNISFTVGIPWNETHQGRPETRRPLKKLRWYFTE